MKKLLACLLSAAMLLISAGFSAFAAEADTWDGTTANTEWYASSESEFSITTAADLAGLAELVNGGTTFKGKTITLAANIDLDGKEWTPIGTKEKPFVGTFDGVDCVISNLAINKPNENNIGLFGNVQGGSAIKNVTIENVTLSGADNIGAVVGCIVSSVSGCEVRGAINITGGHYVGGIAGYAYGSFTDCTVTGAAGSQISCTYLNNNSDGDKVGGIVGYVGEGTYTIEGCQVSNISISGVRGVGGIIGGVAMQKTVICNNTVTDANLSIVDAETNKARQVGGIVGRITPAEYYVAEACSVENNYIMGTDIVGKDPSYTGAFVGGVDNNNADVLNTSIKQNNKAESSTLDGEAFNTFVAYVNEQGYFTLEEALAAAQAGDVVKIIKAGTYDGYYNIDKAITLKGTDGVVFSGVINLAAEGAGLDGLNISYEGPRGVELVGGTYGRICVTANNVSIKNCKIYAKYDEMYPGLGVIWAPDKTGVTIDNCTIDTNVMGIFMAMKSGSVTNCTFTPIDKGNAQPAINNTGMDGVTINNNKLYDGMQIWADGANITISGNEFYNFTYKVVGGNNIAAIDLSGNYWGSENPDFSVLLGANQTVTNYFNDAEKQTLISVATTAISAAATDALAPAEGDGTLRFITKVDALEGTASSFGTWILPMAVFDSWDSELKAIVKYEGETIKAGDTFAADLTGIPQARFGAEIIAQSYIVVGDKTTTCTFDATTVTASAAAN